MAQLVKNLPAMWETWVRSLGCEDPLEKGRATHSSIYSCLENPMVREAWRATVPGVAKSRTRLSDFTYLPTYFLLPKHSSLTRKRWASLFILCLVKIAFLHLDLQFQCVEYQVLMGQGLPSSLVT